MTDSFAQTGTPASIAGQLPHQTGEDGNPSGLSPWRFPNGVNNTLYSTNPLAEYGAMDKTRYAEFFEDFNYSFGATAALAVNWIITTTEAGSSSATEVITDATGGVLLVTNDNADDDNDFFQTTSEIFALEPGKKAWFKARFKVSDATQSDFVMGLQVRDITPLAVSDGVWFQKDDGDAYLDFHVAKSSVQTDATAIATVASNTYLTVAWYYDGINTIGYYVNDTKLGQITTAPTYMPTTELTVSFGLQNGEAAAKTMSVDYIFAARER